jgi:malonyl-CoA/methylmalonyl-CoA synthetase
VELRVVDEQGRDTEDAGELWVRGPMLFAGYLSGGVLQKPLTADGYFQTGDVVRRSAEGGFTILGRASSDILKTGGEKVSALEIEEACREHPEVAEAAVIGVPDPVWGDKIVAIIVLRRPASEVVDAGSVGAAAETEPAAWLKSFLRERLSPFKLPKEIRVVNELPRNAMGTVLKQELRKGEG